MAPEGVTAVVRFPKQCPRCNAVAAMPSRAGTLAEHRTQVDLKCSRCRHEWSLEMTPPVLIVKPDRETDAEEPTTPPAPSTAIQKDKRRESESTRQRMRVGSCGLLRSTDRTHTVAVLYSLNSDRIAGRLRLVDPSGATPPWLAQGSRLWLFDYDGLPLRIRITTVKPPRDGYKDAEQFAEFVVHQVTH